MVFIPKLVTEFANFSSSGRTSLTAGLASDNIQTMSLDQLLHFNRSHHLDFWTKDVKEIFEEVKYKDDSQINFNQFQDAILLFSRLKYPTMSPIESEKRLTLEIINNENSQNSRKRYRLESSGSAENIFAATTAAFTPRSVALADAEHNGTATASRLTLHQKI